MNITILRKYRRVTALTLVLLFVVQWAAPTVSYALTSGPTSPEFSSFEPVDTTDMVNLATGDFVYNNPILEVPGPAGGYPLSLSYHAGTQTNEEASWVGLGWSLSPGSINRTPSNYPDDISGASRKVVDNWAGGSTEYFGAGIGFPGVMAKLTYAEDTYRGTDLGVSLTQSVPFGRIGIDKAPFASDPSVSFSANIASPKVGIGPLSAQAIAGATASFNMNSGEFQGIQGIQGNVELNSGDTNLVGVSLNSAGGNSLSVAGVSSTQVNRKAGNITTNSSGFNFTIPTPKFSLHLSYQYVRYYSHEESNVYTFGSLHPPSGFNPETSSFDSYPIFDKDHSLNKNIETHSAGSLPAYDSYSVTGQGTGGQIQPYTLEFGPLYRQNDNDVSYARLNKQFSRRVNFRFKNDFSGHYTHSFPSINYSGSGSTRLFENFGDDDQVNVAEGGISQNKDHLAGSSHIEWFSNDDILSNTFPEKKFMECDDFSRPRIFSYEGVNHDIGQQIGGFQITGSNGLTYHYSLPVYAFNEYTRSESYDNTKGKVYRETNNFKPYAYTWLLTGITGPDFVDRNNNNRLDDGDWGYWVKFHYGKWAANYKWRNPLTGFHTDIEQNVKFASWGSKEVYYLDAMQTQSHMAVFSKSIRSDAKGLSVNGLEPSVLPRDGEYPVSSLRLDNIYLFKKAEIKKRVFEIRALSDAYNISLSASGTERLLGSNVIDEYDMALLLTGQQKKSILKRIQFSYEDDNQLCKKTTNSYDIDTYTNYSPKPLQGKLTLSNLTTYGKGGVGLIPPLRFGYSDNNPDYDAQAYDAWGFYKKKPVPVSPGSGVPRPSFSGRRGTAPKDNNVNHRTTEFSKNYVDAWSLTTISTPLGSEINVEYESDSYTTPSWQRLTTLSIADLEIENKDNNTVAFYIDPDHYQSMDSVFKKANSAAQKSVLFKLLLAHPYIEWDWEVTDFACKPTKIRNQASDYSTYKTGSDWPIVSIDKNKIVVRVDPELITLLTERKRPLGYPPSPGLAKCLFEDGGVLYLNMDPVFVGGLMHINVDYNWPGGGLRVKKLSVTNSTQNEKKSTVYSYHDLKNPDYTSGVTSYEPYDIGYYNFEKPDTLNYRGRSTRRGANYIYPRIESPYFSNFQEGILKFRDLLTEERGVLQLSKIIPAPGVLYKNVTVRDEVTDLASNTTVTLPDYSIFEFNVFDPGSAENNVYKQVSNLQPVGTPSPSILTTLTILDDYSRVGTLKSKKTFTANNANAVEETRYRYLHDFTNPNQLAAIRKQGMVQQVFYEYKKIREGYYKEFSGGEDANVLQLTTKIEIPDPLIETVSTNSKTGLTVRSQVITFDPFSGAASTTLSTDSYGNRILTEDKPAYTNYPGMGLKIHDPVNKNMLTQNGATYSFTVDAANKPIGLLSASVQTWSDQLPVLAPQNGLLAMQAGIWRKHASYQWNGQAALLSNGSYPLNNFNANPFNWQKASRPGAMPTDNPAWQKSGELTLYDVYSHALEATDINGNYASTRFDPQHDRVITSTANAAYKEAVGSSAEFLAGNAADEGGVNRGNGNPSTAAAHSGKYSLLTGFGTYGFNYTLRAPSCDLAKPYRASVWVYVPGESETQAGLDRVQLVAIVNGAEQRAHPVLQKSKSKSWYLLNLDIEPQGAEVRIECRNGSSRGVYFDDFRVHPLDASMTAYVYDAFSGELTHLLDANNLYTRFEYDAMGRLVRTTREQMNFDFGDGKESFKADQVVGETKYNFKKNN